MAWADLLQRVFEVDALRCPDCGPRMRVLSAITGPDVARRILDCLRMPSRAPPLAASEPRAEERLEEPSSELDWGSGSARIFSCDLTYDYVKINAEYTT